MTGAREPRPFSKNEKRYSREDERSEDQTAMSETTNQSFDADLSAADFRFAIVVSRFNSFVTDPLLAGALAALKQRGADFHDGDVVPVAGARGLPITMSTN